MNKYLTILMIIFTVLSPLMISCSDDLSVPPQSNVVSKYDKMDLSCYPMAKVHNNTSRTAMENGYWESWETIFINKKTEVKVPWSRTGTCSAVQPEILKDVEYSKGWDLIYNPLSITSDDRMNYLVFHNRYTGILKVFYYVENPSLNNNGFWQISIDSPTSLFAFNEEFTYLASNKQTNTICVANNTNCSTKGFTEGWNFFQIELAYDPTQSGSISIYAYNRNTSSITLSGNLSTSTDGYIFSSNEGRDFTKGTAKLIGSKASNWVKKKIEDKTILGIKPTDIASGAEALFTKGAAKLIGAVTGIFSKATQTTQSLQLTTNGTFSIDGEFRSDLTGVVAPLSFDLDPNLVGYLGVWGLISFPTISYSPYAMLNYNQSNYNQYMREYLITGSLESAKVIINPSIQHSAQNISTSTTIYGTEKGISVNAFNNNGLFGKQMDNLEKVYDNLYKSQIGIIANVQFKGVEYGEYYEIDKINLPMEVFIPSVPNGPDGVYPNFTFIANYVGVVMVSMTTDNGDEAISIHKCLPNYQWRYSEFNNGLYQYLYPCEPIYMK